MNDPDPNPGARKREIFLEALGKSDPRERATFLEAVCANDAELGRAVKALLAHHTKDDFLEAPAAALDPADPLAASLPEKPGDRIGRYRLLEQIGQGGFGTVWQAEQEEPVRRQVALKVIKLGTDTRQVIARFEIERQALALMDHPNIAKVLDAGATPRGRPYFVMELIRGVRITEFCDQHKLPPAERLALFAQVCHAIQHAHQKGIIHRDIKPSNILVTVHDGVPVPKVIDFGIARATQAQLSDRMVFTRAEELIGTPAYMSPEQADPGALDLDTRSDIYALGVLLYELLTGRTPFDAKALRAAGLDEVRRIIREQEPMRPSARISTLADAERALVAMQRHFEAPKLIHLIRGDLDWIAMKCLEKDRRRRYETANSLAQDVERHLHQQPVLARPASAAYRLRKFVRRNKVLVSAVAAVAVALAVGAVTSTWLAVRATQAKKEQTRQRLRAEAGERFAQRLLYVANMNLIQVAWEQNNLALIRELLDQTAAWPERGFEWYYWQRQTHLERKTIRTRYVLTSLALSPDGRRIAIAGGGYTKLWDAASGRELVTLQPESGMNNIWHVAYSPDGQRIATSNDGGIASLWDATTGRMLLRLNSRGFVGPLAFSPDGQRLVTAGMRKTATVWETTSGKELFTLALDGITNYVSAVAYSPDGQRIATGGRGALRVCDAVTGQQLLALEGDISWFGAIAFSPDSRRIAAGVLNAAKVWETATGKELLTLTGHGAQVTSLAYSPDGRHLVTGSGDQTARIWDAATGQGLFILKGHDAGITSVAWTRDGQSIVTGSRDGTAKVWEVGRLWETILGNGLGRLNGHGGPILAAAYAPDGQRVITGSADHTAKVWDVATGKPLLTLLGHTNAIVATAFSPDAQRIVTISCLPESNYDQTVKVWDATSGKELSTCAARSEWGGFCVVSPDSQRIIGFEEHKAVIRDAATAHQLLTLAGGDRSYAVTSGAYSLDGRRIIGALWGGPARIWEATTGRTLLTLRGSHGAIRCAAFSPDGQRLVTGSDGDRTASVWDAVDGREMLTLKGHNGHVSSVAFSPDGQRIVTACSDASSDQTIRVWETVTGRQLLTLRGERISSVGFSPDGLRLIVNSYQQAQVFDGATPQQVEAWRSEEQAHADRVAATLREWEAAAEQRARAAPPQDRGTNAP